MTTISDAAKRGHIEAIPGEFKAWRLTDKGAARRVS
jgi:hypothetical protein